MGFIFILPLTDPDYFWHLKAGEYIFTKHTLPIGDIFSFSRFGQPWVLHEWLFELVLYGMYALLGPLGVKLLTATLATSSLGITYAILRRARVSPILAFLMLLFAFIPFGGGISPRPQLVTYVFFAIFLYVLLSYKYFNTTKYLFTLPLLMVVWVNSHGGYVTGIVLLGLFIICELPIYWVSSDRDNERKKQLLRLTYSLIAIILASLINPDFINHWLYPFQVLGMEANRQISEWQSPNFHNFDMKIYLMLVFTLFISYIYAEVKPDLTEIFVPGFLIVGGFISIRHIPLATLAIISFIAISLSRWPVAGISSLWHRSRVASFYKKRVGGSKELGQLEYLLNWIVLLIVAFSLFIAYPIYHASDEVKINETLPVNAANFVVLNGITGNMFNSYTHGGYLIYRLAPDRKVFIDGRADVYGDKFIKDFSDIYQGNAMWKDKFDKLSIDYVICDINAPIRQLLLAEQSFKEVYIDKFHSVLLRNTSEQKMLLARLGK
ncbi:hypothetical protein SAMN05216344_112136 [Polaromonas sp. OV174]|nr:hypothetical protein SAMN05216344_112136 [Polaromonas sp. OV174]